MVNVIHKCVSVIVLSLVCIIFTDTDVFADPHSLVTNNTAKHFIENKGQIKDQHNQFRQDIDFKLPAGNLSIFIGSGKIHYQWNKPIYTNAVKDENSYPDRIATYRLDVALEGANTGVTPIAEEKAVEVERYYTPDMDGVSANTYRKITYKNIYNHIDWVLYMKGDKLKYDFIIHPGGNTDDIRIKYNGATSLNIVDGDVVATTPYGQITEQAPYTYYAHINVEVPSQYQMHGNTITFSIADYKGPIVIDPSLAWATYMGSSGNEYAYDLVVDSAKNVYMAGSTTSTTSSNIATSNGFIDTFSGNIDGYVSKYTPAGVRVWSTYYGGYGRDIVNSVTTNSDGDIFFSGVTDTSSTLATSGAHHGGASDAFLVKMSTSGVRTWATYYGGAGDEADGDGEQTYVICDNYTNVYIVGRTTSDTGIATTGTAQATRSNDFDGYLAKFNKNGIRQWSTYYGGTYDDYFTRVSTDSIGIVYVLGEFKSDALGTTGTYAPNWKNTSTQTSNNTRPTEILIAKFDPNTGQKVWATYYGGAGTETAGGIIIDRDKNVFISGATTSSTDIVTSGASQGSIGGQFDAFLAGFDSSGQRVWGTYMGGSGADYGGNIVLDEVGNINLAGRTSSTSGIATTGAHRLNKIGSSSLFDAMMAIYSPSGSKIWGTYYGGASNDYGYGIATAVDGVIYLCGHTESDTGIAYSGAQNSHVLLNDGFLAKFTPDTSAFVFQPFTQTVHCIEDSFVLNYGVTNPFLSGNTFTVQLSDNSGSFSSPVNIGSKAGTTGGTIKVGLPGNMTGTGFRIRIVSTIPIDTSFDNGNDILIKPKPTTPVASNNGPVCSNLTLNLSSTASSSGASFTWTGPGSYVEYGQNVTRTNMSSAHSGDYIVTVDLNGCTRADTTSVIIKQAAPKPLAQNNGPLCSGDNLQLTAGNVSSGVLTWSGPNSYSASQQNPVITNVTTNDAGDYIVNVVQNGCDSKDTTSVTIGQTPAPVVASSNSPVCSSDTLWLHAVTTTSGIIYNWQGPGSYNSNTTQTDNPRTNLQTSYSGNYIVTADLQGCSVKDTITVTILQAPAKPVAGSNGPLCSGADMQLTGTNATTGASYEWSGPGGYAKNGLNQTEPNIQVGSAGSYILEAKMGNGCAQSDTVIVAITQSTTIPVSINSNLGTVVCPSANLTFTATPSQPGGTQYLWSGPGNWTSNNITATRNNVQYIDSGYYKLRIVTSSCGFGTDSIFLRVVDTISPPILTTNSPVCEGDTLKLISTHPGNNTPRSWETPTGSIGLPGPQSLIVHVAALTDAGTYIVNAEAGGCKASDTAIVVVKPKPAKPSSGSNSPLCEGETLELTANGSTSGITYLWQGPGGFTSTSQNPSLPNVMPVVNAGDYEVRTVLNGCPSDASITNVIVNENPKPQIKTDASVCEGSTLTMSVDDDAVQTFSWTRTSGGFTSTGPGATINEAKISDNDKYIVTATSTVTGCKGSDSVDILVIPLPGILDVSYNSPLCEGKGLELYISDTSTGEVKYAWTGPQGYTFLGKSATKSAVELTDAGKYYVIASRFGCTRKSDVDVNVKPTPPKPDITSNSPLSAGDDLYLELLNPFPGTSFSWKGPNGFGSLIQNPVIYNVGVNASGPYDLRVTLDGCTSASTTIVVVENVIKKEELILFPNPNTGTFTVKALLHQDQVMPYEVVSIVGTVIHRGTAESKDLEMVQKVEIDGGLASGVYIFRIIMSGKSKEVPFTIVR